MFDYANWVKSDYAMIAKGLLPNISNKADQQANSYNIYDANLDSDNDLLAFGLTGFRHRQYMVDLNLDDVSQVLIYQGFFEIINNIEFDIGFDFKQDINKLIGRSSKREIGTGINKPSYLKESDSEIKNKRYVNKNNKFLLIQEFRNIDKIYLDSIYFNQSHINLFIKNDNLNQLFNGRFLLNPDNRFLSNRFFNANFFLNHNIRLKARMKIHQEVQNHLKNKFEVYKFGTDNVISSQYLESVKTNKIAPGQFRLLRTIHRIAHFQRFYNFYYLTKSKEGFCTPANRIADFKLPLKFFTRREIY
jgi:hypothetical protein